MSEQVFTFPTYDLAQSILGQHNRYLHMMLEVISVDVVARGDTVVIKGDEKQVEALYRTLEELVFYIVKVVPSLSPKFVLRLNL